MSSISADETHVTSFRVDVQPERDVVFVAPVGELDLATVGELAGQLDQLCEAGFKRLALDLRGLRFMDTAALHLIIDADARARQDGHQFALISGPPVVQRVFELTGLSERFCSEEP